jgi:hypothetical protein
MMCNVCLARLVMGVGLCCCTFIDDYCLNCDLMLMVQEIGDVMTIISKNLAKLHSTSEMHLVLEINGHV